MAQIKDKDVGTGLQYLFYPFKSNPLYRDITYPLRQFSEVQGFISRTEGAYLTMALVSFFLFNAGYAKAVSGAVGTLALASSATTVLLRIFFNQKDPLNQEPVTIKGKLIASTKVKNTIGVIATLLMSIIVYAWLNGNAITNTQTFLLQFGFGLAIVYIGGLTYLRVFSHYCDTDKHQAIIILIPALTTFGVIAASLIFIDTASSFLGLEQFTGLIQTGNKTG